MDFSFSSKLRLSRLTNRNSSGLLLTNGAFYTFGGDESVYGEDFVVLYHRFPRLMSCPIPIEQVCIGNAHTIFLSSENKVYGLGSNQFGQLGFDPSILKHSADIIALEIDVNHTIKQIDTGIAGGTCIVTVDGGLHSAGELNGRICTMDSPGWKFLPIPQEYFDNEPVVFASCGGCVGLFVTASGGVFVHGYDSNAEAKGMLGLGSTLHQTQTVIKLTSLWDTNIRVVSGSAGRSHAMVIDREGKVFGWGCNRQGQLGIEGLEDVLEPVCISDQNLLKNDTCVQVSCSWYHSLLLAERGTVFSCGGNFYGELGCGERHNTLNTRSKAMKEVNISNVASVNAGQYHSLFVMNESCGDIQLQGNMFRSCGLGSHNQLGYDNDTCDCFHDPTFPIHRYRCNPTSYSINVLDICNKEERVEKVPIVKAKSSRGNGGGKKGQGRGGDDSGGGDDGGGGKIRRGGGRRSGVLDMESIEDGTKGNESERWIQVIARAEQIVKEMDIDASDDCEKDAVLGDVLWSKVIATLPSNAEKNKAMRKYVQIIISSIKGFSDYRDCYAGLSYFLAMGVKHLSVPVALECVKACVLMYSTHEVDSWFVEHWAVSSLEVCLTVLKSTCETIESTNTTDKLSYQNDVIAVCNILQKIVSAGDEYEKLLAARSQEISGYVAHIAAHVKAVDKGAPKLMQHLRRAIAICASDENKLVALEENIDVLVVNYKLESQTLLDAYNLMCFQDEASLLLQQRAVHGNLVFASFRILDALNEGNDKSCALLQAACFLSLLLSPWDSSSEQHMKAKHELTAILSAKGLFEKLLKHLRFWAIDWNGAFGDIGRPIFVCTQHMVLSFNELAVQLAQEAEVMAMLRQHSHEVERPAKRLHSSFDDADSPSHTSTALLTVIDSLSSTVSGNDTL